LAPAALANYESCQLLWLAVCRDEIGGGGVTYLQRKETHTTRTLGNNPLARLELLEAVQRVPAGHGGAAKSTGLDVVQVGRRADEAHLVEGAVGTQRALQAAAQGGGDGLGPELAVLVALVEERDDLVALLPLRDARADLDDLAGTVRGGYLGELDGEGVHALCLKVLKRSAGRIRVVYGIGCSHGRWQGHGS
jgi:hypothetical protein